MLFECEGCEEGVTSSGSTRLRGTWLFCCFNWLTVFQMGLFDCNCTATKRNKNSADTTSGNNNLRHRGIYASKRYLIEVREWDLGVDVIVEEGGERYLEINTRENDFEH